MTLVEGPTNAHVIQGIPAGNNPDPTVPTQAVMDCAFVTGSDGGGIQALCTVQLEAAQGTSSFRQAFTGSPIEVQVATTVATASGGAPAPTSTSSSSGSQSSSAFPSQTGKSNGEERSVNGGGSFLLALLSAMSALLVVVA